MKQPATLTRPTIQTAAPVLAGRDARPGWLAWRAAWLRRGGLVLIYALVAVALTWPLAPHLSDHLPDYGDPLDSVWRLGWGQHQLLHDPLHLFNARVFYPYARSYLFDELLIGVAIIMLPLRLVTANPVAIYNLALLTSFVLSALAMYALARRLRCAPSAAFVAGLIYAFAPLRLDHLTHLGLLSGQYFPLAILLLDRIFAEPAGGSAWARWRDPLALAAVLALQALSAQYYAFYLLFVVGGFVGLRVVQEGWRRRFPSLAVWLRLAVAGSLVALVMLPFGLGYRTVQGDYAVERSIDQNAYYSANLASFVTADGRNWLWGTLTAPLRHFGTYTLERNSFPGLLALLLALVGAATAWRKPLAQYLILLGLGAALLALGPNLYVTADNKSILFGHMPYGFLYYHLPGFDSMRVPARFGILFLLSVAGLAGLGLTWLLARTAAWRPQPGGGRRAALPVAVALAVCVGIVVESLNRPLDPVPLASGDAVPPAYRWLADQPGAVLLELPLAIPDHPDRLTLLNELFQYYTLFHDHTIVNGSANVLPKGYKALYYEFREGITPRSLAILQGLGVTHLVVHYDELPEDVAEHTRAVLGERGSPAGEAAAFGGDVVYRVAPTERFAQLRALIPPAATIYLSKEDPIGTYGGMLGRVLRANRIYTRVRVEFGQHYAGLPDDAARYDYAILYRDEDPAAAGFAGATVVWEDDVVRVYRRE